MTRTPIIVIACALAANAAAADPTLAHQGRLLDALGGPVSGAHTLRLALYDDATGGTQLHTEDFSLTILDGYYAVVLGEDTGNLITASDLAGDVWLEIILNPPAAPLGARQKLHDVPRSVQSHLQVAGPEAACDESSQSTLRWTGADLQICENLEWVGVGGDPLASQSNPATSCLALHIQEPDLGSDLYWVFIAGVPTQVYCDMDTDGGGWALIARYIDAPENGNMASTSALGTLTHPGQPTYAKLDDASWVALQNAAGANGRMRLLSDTPVPLSAIDALYWDISSGGALSNNTQSVGQFDTALVLQGPYTRRSTGCSPHYTNWGAYEPGVLFVCHHGVGDYGGIYNNGSGRAGTVWIR